MLESKKDCFISAYNQSFIIFCTFMENNITQNIFSFIYLYVFELCGRQQPGYEQKVIGRIEHMKGMIQNTSQISNVFSCIRIL